MQVLLFIFSGCGGKNTGGLTWSAGLVLSTSQPVYQKTWSCVAPKVKINSWGLPIVFCLWENYGHDRVFLLRDSDLAQRQTHTFQAKKYRMLKKRFINLIGRISFHLLFAPYILCLILWLIKSYYWENGSCRAGIEFSLQPSQKPATCSSPEPAESNHQLNTTFNLITFTNLLPLRHQAVSMTSKWLKLTEYQLKSAYKCSNFKPSKYFEISAAGIEDRFVVWLVGEEEGGAAPFM